MTGDGHGIGAADAAGTGNLYVPVTSVGSTTNNLCLNNQSNVGPSQQVTTMEPQSIDQPEKVNFPSQYPLKENLVQSHQQQQFQRSSHQFQHRQLTQHQMQHQLLLKSDSLNQPQLLSNMVPEVKSEIGADHHDGDLQSKVSNPFHFSDNQNQAQSNSMEGHSRATQHYSQPSAPQDVPSSVSQASDRMQPSFHQQQFVSNTRSDFASLSGGMQPDAALGGQRYSNPQDVHVSGKFPSDQNVQDDFHHRLTGQGGAQLNNLSSEESVIGHSDTSKSAEPLNMSNTVSRTNNSLTREKQYKNQQRWLLFLRHARRCPAPAGKCYEPCCLAAQKLIKHMDGCKEIPCAFPRCSHTKSLINHQARCRDSTCPVCIPVKNFILAHLARSELSSGLPSLINESSNCHDTAETVGRSTQKMGPVIVETPADLQPPTKRMKVEQGSKSLVSKSECSIPLASKLSDSHIQDAQHTSKDQSSHIPVKSEINEVKMEVPERVAQLTPKNTGTRKDNLDYAYIQSSEGDGVATNDAARAGVHQAIKPEKEMAQAKLEKVSVSSENVSKSGKPKIKGVSMIELFTPEQVREHIMGLRQWIGQVSHLYIVYLTRPISTLFLF